MADQRPKSRPESSSTKQEQYCLVVSRYDRVASMLISLLILLGLTVLMMLVLFLSKQVWGSVKSVPIEQMDIGDQEEDPMGPGDDIEPPPPQETDLEEEEMVEVLNAVEDALATRSAMLERAVSGTGTGKGGGGTGRGRKGVRRKWELRFTEGNTLETYAQQLDFFGIELGILRPGNKVLYVSGLSRARPLTREGPRDAEKRYRFTWTQGSLEEADRLLLAKAGVDVGRNMIFKFVPGPLYQKLAAMEQEASGGQKVRSVLFGVRSAGGGYEFYVMRWSPL
jgi:hypothetical protein